MLLEDLKAIRMKMVGGIISPVDKDPSLPELLLETRNRVFYATRNLKERQQLGEKSPQSSHKQKFLQVRSKVILDVFFHILRRLCESIRKKRPKFEEQINLEVDGDDVQGLLNSHIQKMTFEDLIQMHEKKQDIEELESSKPVQSEEMTVGNLTEGLTLIEKGFHTNLKIYI
ncbi:hypothetical protein TNCV_4016491 [Trichonephila clavipes]|nr:hypothetical protein TNCV_4016491 [Trichonephila clavipes]